MLFFKYCTVFLSSLVKNPNAPCAFSTLTWFSSNYLPLQAQVRWALQNEASITGSLDKAVAEQFPEYQSRRLAHWKKQYFSLNWEAIPDSVAARCSQVPNRFRKSCGGTLKGPGMARYHLPQDVENCLFECFCSNPILKQCNRWRNLSVIRW